MVALLFRVLFLVFVSVAVLKGQTAEHPLILVGQVKKQTDVKQDSVSRAERVKKVISLGGAVAVPIVSSTFCTAVTATLYDDLLDVKNSNKKLLQKFVLVFFGSVVGSGGGLLATKLLPAHSYRTKVAAWATLPIPFLITYYAVNAGLLRCL